MPAKSDSMATKKGRKINRGSKKVPNDTDLYLGRVELDPGLALDERGGNLHDDGLYCVGRTPALQFNTRSGILYMTTFRVTRYLHSTVHDAVPLRTGESIKKI
jgi:hypothetical protein